VQSGKWLRLVPPPGKAQWVLRVERHATGFGQQTHFRIERASPDAPKAGGGAEVVWLRARATGGYVNYRGENFVRGHGNRKKAGGGLALGLTLTLALTLTLTLTLRRRAAAGPLRSAAARVR